MHKSCRIFLFPNYVSRAVRIRILATAVARQTTRSLVTTRTMGTIKPYPYNREVFDVARRFPDELLMKI
jgi:hypothetical protein